MKEQKKRNSKQQIRNTNNGITLIALIITIILMLILASITVNVAINGGLFEYAGNAKGSTEIAGERETVQKATIIAESTSKTGRVTVEEMQKAINKVASDNTATAMDNGDTIVVKFNESSRYYEVDNKGKVEGPKELVKKEYAGDITKGGAYDGSSSKPFKITCIEDLVAFSIMTNQGDSALGLKSSQFTGQYIELTTTLDFKSIFSYNDYATTIYGDLNKDGKIEDIKTELTKKDEGCIGFTGMYDFQGEFDGNGEEIKNLYQNSTSSTGFFSSINNAKIRNLGITGEIIAGGYAGGIVHTAQNSEISDCWSKVSIMSQISSTYGTGGICARLEGGNISNCYNIGTIEGKSTTGGIVGTFYGTIENCYNEGKIISNNYSGGIVGEFNAAEASVIKNCYNNGEVHALGTGSGGGILGRSRSTQTSSLLKIVNCYNLKSVKSGRCSGGIAGILSTANVSSSLTAQIINCYNLGSISSTTTSTYGVRRYNR